MPLLGESKEFCDHKDEGVDRCVDVNQTLKEVFDMCMLTGAFI